jgi:ATP-dependent DNA helicase RecQ
VARVKNGFGINQIISILRGENTEGIRKWNHQELTTYGLLKEFQKADLRDWIYQLIGQGVLRQSEDEYPKLHLNDGSWEVMRGRRQVRLLQMVRRPKGERPARSKDEEISWEGVDRALFEVLRKLRRDLAAERAVPPYVVFHDGVLREMARVFPSTPERLRRLSGVGEARLRDYGAQFLEAIREHCTSNALQQDVVVRVAPPTPRTPSPLQPLTPAQSTAFAYFRTGTKVDDVVAKLERTRSTIIEYLCEFIRREQPPSIIAWVSPTIYAAVQRAAKTEGLERLKPIYLALGEKVSYDDIRLVVTHLTLRSNPSSA